MKHGLLIVIWLLIISSIALVGCSQAVPAPSPTVSPPSTSTPEPVKPVVFEAVSFQPKIHKGSAPVSMFAEAIAKKSNGAITIKWLGGPEVIPAGELHVAISKGAMDIALVPATRYAKEIPETTYLGQSEVPANVERERGLYGYMGKLHRELWNTVWLGRTKSLDPFYYVLKTDRTILAPKDISGLKISVPVQNRGISNKLGMVVTQVDEEYTALERGVISGVCSPPGSVADDGVFEIATHLIDQPFNSGAIILVMNRQKFESLPSNLQNMMFNTLWELEPAFKKFYDDYLASGFKKAQDNKIKIVKFSPDDQKWAENLNQATTDEAMKKLLSDVQYTAMKKFIFK